jgi:hypothetical protein
MLIVVIMDAEREIVKVYFTLLKKPYLSELNAGKRVIDFVLFDEQRIVQVEVSCSLTKKSSAEDESLLISRFEDPSVAAKLQSVCDSYNIESYDKMLITSIGNVRLKGVDIISFSDVLQEVLSELDTQHYSDGTIRGLQIVKHLLLYEQGSIARLYDSKIIRKKHIRMLSRIIHKHADILSPLSQNEKTILLSALFDGDQMPSFDGMNKQKLQKVVAMLGESAQGRRIIRDSLSEQKSLSSFKKK